MVGTHYMETLVVSLEIFSHKPQVYTTRLCEKLEENINHFNYISYKKNR